MSTAAHDEAQLLLPWLANGSLASAELERTQSHVRDCAKCRADLAALRTLRAAGTSEAPDCDPGRALARLLPQLDVPFTPELTPPLQPTAPQVVPGWRQRFAANERSWLRRGAVLQLGAIAVLATLLAHRSSTPVASEGAYRALGAAPAMRAKLIVTFRPDTPEREIRRIVRGSGAHLVGGPTATDAWLLDADDATPTVLQGLRREPAVTLAESLTSEGQP